jgi:hypothetical protein
MSGEPDVGTDTMDPMRFTTEAMFQYSDKIGDGIILVRGDSFPEFTSNLVDVFGQEGTDARLLSFESKKGDVIATAVDNLNNAGVTTTSSAGRSCPHGAMTKRTGTSGKGPWTGYFCPLPKGNADQCKPQFV